jgi:hypothetical protein
MKKQIVSLAFAAVTLTVAPIVLSPAAYAQSATTGAISGTITDPSGAAVPNASISIKNTSEGSTQETKSNGSGNYRASLLKPGSYLVSVSADGFTGSDLKVTVSAAGTATGDIKLTLGGNQVTVEVAASAIPLLHTEDAQITTVFDAQQVQSLPNPGNDLTFIAQTAPGSVMNTQGGYGNFSSFGLPATSNTFTVNGGYENDPFLNLSNSGATNLLLGNNDVDTVTVTSPAYDASFGGLAGAQVSEISRSGSNAFHGNASYWWNGSVLNANDWFNNNSGTAKPRSNANQWAAAIGGPIKRDKLFFFVNTEGLRVIIPTRGTIYAPSAKWQNIITNPAAYNDSTSDACSTYSQRNTTPDAGCYAPLGNLAAQGLSAEAPLYQTIFKYFNSAPGAAAATPVAGDDRFVQFNANSSNFAQEWIITGRTDYNITDKDKLNVRYKQDKGVQPTYTSLISPLFNASSPQPSYEGQLNYTRTITPRIVNQLLVTGSYYRAIFSNTSQAAATASIPQVFIPEDGAWVNNTGSGQYVGGEDYAFPQGRNVTGYQFGDDLSISHGNHTIKVGWSMRRDDVTDYSPSEHLVPENIIQDNASFAAGLTDKWRVNFSTRSTQPVAVYNMGMYAQDSWKAMPNLTVTAGVRLEHNSNPICTTNCFSNFAGTFGSLSASQDTPYTSLLSYNRHSGYLSQQVLGINPRVSFAYQPGGVGSKTSIRVGFGMFTDSFPAQIASSLLTNLPGVTPFTINGAAFGNPYTADGTRADSAQAVATQSNAALRANFASNGTFNTISAATGGAFAAPSFVGTTPNVKLPTAEEWSFQVEQQLFKNTVVSVGYVGNHGYHGAVQNYGINGFGGVAGLSATAPNPSFGATTVYNTNNQSNYSGLLITANHRSSWLTVGFNYQYSHALDLVSNGGFNGFSNNPEGQEDPSNISRNYGNADYDIRQYISGNYIFNTPRMHGLIGQLTSWEISGTVFHSTGLPFTVLDSNAAPANYGGTIWAQQTTNSFGHRCGAAANAGVNATPCGFVNAFTSATALNQQNRNQLTGPGFTDTDMSIMKTFPLPFRESKLKLGAQFFNLLNHPNFAQPQNDVADSSSIGTIQSTVNTPTSILGSFLGGDASPRLIQLKGTFTF